MSVGRHHERSAVGMTELHSNVSVRDAQLEQMGRAEVPKLIEVHSGPAECRADRTPVVVQAALRELAAPRSYEEPRNVDPRHDVAQSLLRWRRQCYNALL